MNSTTYSPDTFVKVPSQRKKLRRKPLFSADTALPALKDAFVMLRPDVQWKNPVMFVVEVGAILTLVYIVMALFGKSDSQVPISYFVSLDVWLFVTVLFANFATAIAEARGKAQAESLRRTRRDTIAHRLMANGKTEEVASTLLKAGDEVVVKAGQIVPGDGEIFEGIASIDESAITGESAPVIREAGGDRSGVVGGTMVISDSISVRITGAAGESFLDKMIALVEGAIRQRTPNEIALTLVLSALTLIFLIVVIPLVPMAWNAEQYMTAYLGLNRPLKSLGTDVPTLIALLVCLIPTTIGALLAASALREWSGRCVITSSQKVARPLKPRATSTSFFSTKQERSPWVTARQPSSCRWEIMQPTRFPGFRPLRRHPMKRPEGKSIVKAYEKKGLGPVSLSQGSHFVPFSAQTRMSGVDLPDGRRIRKGAADAIISFVESQGGTAPETLRPLVERVASKGATPLVVADGNR